MIEDQLSYYVYKKKKYRRVTSILSIVNDIGINNFKAAVSPEKFNDVIEHAIKRGKQFHDIVQKYTEGKINDIVLKGIQANRPELYEPTKLFIDWAEKYIDKFLLVEKTIFCHTHMYAGTPDFIALCLFDISL